MQLREIIFFAILLTGFKNLTGQEPNTAELFQELKSHDSIFFERSFNRCDIKYLEGAIDADLIFYHDRSGTQNRAKFIENTRRNICGDPIKKPIRKVDEKSLAVFPMYNNGVLYGALHTGNHSFFIREKNKEDVLTGSAKFIHLYLLVADRWILKEVISFDHQSPG